MHTNFLPQSILFLPQYSIFSSCTIPTRVLSKQHKSRVMFHFPNKQKMPSHWMRLINPPCGNTKHVPGSMFIAGDPEVNKTHALTFILSWWPGFSLWEMEAIRREILSTPTFPFTNPLGFYSVFPSVTRLLFMSPLSIWMVAQTVKRLPIRQRPGFNPWVGKTSWRRKWQSTPVFLPGKFHGWRSLVGYNLWGRRVRHNSETSLSLSLSIWILDLNLSWPPKDTSLNILSILHHLFSSALTSLMTSTLPNPVVNSQSSSWWTDSLLLITIESPLLLEILSSVGTDESTLSWFSSCFTRCSILIHLFWFLI